MHDRRLVFPRRFLGRAFPSDIEDSIKKLSDRLDSMMASSVNLAMAADQDLSGKISEVNTQLVNDVVLPSDQISDEDAHARIANIEKEVQDLENTFFENNVEIGQGAGKITANVIPENQAKDLMAQMDKAFNIYASIVDRYGLIRGYVSAASALPSTGQKLTDMLSAFDGQIRAIDQKISPVRKYNGDLETALVNVSGGAVPINRDEVLKMQQWAASVFQADEALKRIEAIALRKPVEATPAAKSPHGTPWAVIGIAGILLVGLAFWAVTD